MIKLRFPWAASFVRTPLPQVVKLRTATGRRMWTSLKTKAMKNVLMFSPVVIPNKKVVITGRFSPRKQKENVKRVRVRQLKQNRIGFSQQWDKNKRQNQNCGQKECQFQCTTNVLSARKEKIRRFYQIQPQNQETIGQRKTQNRKWRSEVLVTMQEDRVS